MQVVVHRIKVVARTTINTVLVLHGIGTVRVAVIRAPVARLLVLALITGITVRLIHGQIIAIGVPVTTDGTALRLTMA